MKYVLVGRGGLCIVIYAPAKHMNITDLTALNIAKANLALARATEDLATMAVWEADLGKDADEARVVYRRVVENRRKAEALVEGIVKTM